MSKSTPITSETLAFLLLRLWLGFRALIAGIEKYTGTVTKQEPLLGADGKADPSGALVEFDQKVYGLTHYHALPEVLQTRFTAEPLIPGFTLPLFYAILGPLLILIGLALIVGLKTRWVLFINGLLYLALTAGLLLLHEDAGVSWLAIHIGLIAFALYLEKANRFSLTK